MSYYKNGIISIPNVSGDVVITATAVQSAVINQIRNAINADGTPYNGGLGYSNLGRRIKSSFVEVEGTAVEYVTGYIPISGHTDIYVDNMMVNYQSVKSTAGVMTDYYDIDFSHLSRGNGAFEPAVDGEKNKLKNVPSGAAYLRITTFEADGFTRDMATVTFD